MTLRRLLFAGLTFIFLVALACFWSRCGAVAVNLEPERVVAARPRAEALLRRKCQELGLAYPPRQLFLRVFKAERLLEAWVREGEEPYRCLAVWPVLAASGQPGPKRREGDLQVPEGCYQIVVFNPRSSFHLSLGLDPNASDRHRSDPERPGFDIYLHGGGASIGCVAIGDEGIEELYILARDITDRAKQPIPVHLFPAHMKGEPWTTIRREHPQHAEFWSELKPIYQGFQQTHLLPHITIGPTGEYRLTP